MLQRVVINKGLELSELKDLLVELDKKNIVLFTGQKSYEGLAGKNRIEQILKKYNYSRYSNIFPNPKIENINDAVEYLEKNDTELILAIGGGSVLDTAKSARYLSKEMANIPLIAIPTTAGTGSESTQFATYYIDKKKNSFDDPMMLPNFVVLCGSFTKSLPSKIAAQTGADALCQAIESFWNVKSSIDSRRLASEAIIIIMGNIKKVVNENDPIARKQMLRGSNLAGQAINITRTTASHSISYPITSYFGVPHGQAVSISIPEMLEYNWNVTEECCTDERGLAFVKVQMKDLATLLGGNNIAEARKNLEELFESIGLETKLSKLINSKSDIDTIVENGFTPSRMKNNPRAIEKDNLINILEKIY